MNDEVLSAPVQQQQFGGIGDADLPGRGSNGGAPKQLKAQYGMPTARQPSTSYDRPPSETGEGVGEVMGDPALPSASTENAGAHEEVANYGGTETGEEYFEASPEQLSAESGE